MFSMRNFVKDGFLKAVGKMADYQIILNAASWHEKGVLTEEDLAEIQSAISAKNAVEDAPDATEEMMEGA
ncbi:MAG: hypothetical protein IKB79_05030 [Oscillospiraceae bacterium]|nr:hypothetical protein [Oscillospiraceae bacterium]